MSNTMGLKRKQSLEFVDAPREEFYINPGLEHKAWESVLREGDKKLRVMKHLQHLKEI